MKPTTKDIEIAKKIVNDLIENEFLNAIITDDNCSLSCWSHDYKEYLERKGITVHCGETKACIISNELTDWVIKVGFIDSDDEGGHTTDFCAIEEGNYRSAVDMDLDEFFAAIYELCSVTPDRSFFIDSNITFFIQEKAVPNEEKTSNTCDNYMKKYYSEGEGEEEWYPEGDDYDRVGSLFEGDERVDELIDFLDNWNINDLHSGNFGYTGDGKVKIIDYSGYYEG